MKKENWAMIILACSIGFVIAKIDTSKNWNDTGITVGLILASCFVLGAIKPGFAWLFAIIIGGFVFGFNAIQSNNYSSAGALLFAFIGAYSGFLFRRFFFGSTSE